MEIPTYSLVEMYFESAKILFILTATTGPGRK